MRRRDIDTARWDDCIQRAANGCAYAYSWYLDAMAPRWDALVGGDYEAVFPLAWNRKLVLCRQLYQPFLAQQHGLFGLEAPTPALLHDFLLAAAAHFRRIHISVNSANPPVAVPGFSFEPRDNYQLDLQRPYEEIRAGYQRSLRKHLNKAKACGFVHDNTVSLADFLALYQTDLGQKVPFGERDYGRIAQMMQAAMTHRCGYLIGLRDPDGTLCMAGFYLHSHGLVINLMSATTPAGRQLCAKHYMIDHIIRIHAGTPTILDFEGSSIPSIAEFFRSFGSRSVPYYAVTYDGLPAWLMMGRKLLKVLRGARR